MKAKWLQKIQFLLNAKYGCGYYPELALYGLGSCSSLYELEIQSEPILSQYQVLHTFLEVFMKALKLRKDQRSIGRRRMSASFQCAVLLLRQERNTLMAMNLALEKCYVVIYRFCFYR